jgi:dihydroflavonol-4-reductase
MANDPARNPNNIILSTINSGLVLGPSLVPATGRYSIDTLKDIAEGKTSMIPDMNIQIVDVRDCARMHITIMNDPSTDGHRHLSTGAVGKFIDIATAGRDQYGSRGFAPAPRLLSKCVPWGAKFFSEDVAAIYPKVGHDETVETLYPTVYRYRYTNIPDIVRDSMDKMIEDGCVTPIA